jgi:hypothetical protein
MPNNQSWEFYQQPDTNTVYPLDWLVGPSTAVGPAAKPLLANRLYLVPFNQMRSAVLVKMGIDLRVKGAAGAKLRLGLYHNNASNDNYPTTLVINAGEMDVSPAGVALGCNFLTLSPIIGLAYDVRYWAALLTNDPTVQIDGLPTQDMFFWGALGTTKSALKTLTYISVAQTYGPLPNTAPLVDVGDLTFDTSAPAVILGFSDVT